MDSDSSTEDESSQIREIDDPALKKQQRRAEREHARIKREFEEGIFVRERAEEARMHANHLFKNDRLSEAEAAYHRCLKLCTSEKDRVVLYANLAAVHIKQYRWNDALAMCTSAIRVDPRHSKAWYRVAQARRGLKQPDAALIAIAIARECATSMSAELDALEANAKKDIAKVEKEWDDKRAAELRQRARLMEKLKREQQKLKVREHGLGLPPVPTPTPPPQKQPVSEPPSAAMSSSSKEVLDPAERRAATTGTSTASASAAGESAEPGSSEPHRASADVDVGSVDTGSAVLGSADWSHWFRELLARELTDRDKHMLIHELDGWIIGLDVPSDTCSVDASVEYRPGGRRMLYYDVALKLYCQVCACRGTWDDQGFVSFHIVVAIANIDCATTPEEWQLSVNFATPMRSPSKRVRQLMEVHVPKVVPHVKAQLKECIEQLRTAAMQVQSNEHANQ